MKKKNSKKAKIVGMNDLKQEVDELQEHGEDFGDAIIRLMALMTHDYKSLVVCAVGLARAVASLKDVSKHVGADVSKLYDSEQKLYERYFTEVLSKGQTK